MDDEGDKWPKKAKKKKVRPPLMVLKAGKDMEAEFWKARVAAYHESMGDKKPEKDDINPVLDDVINADIRGIGCEGHSRCILETTSCTVCLRCLVSIVC